MGSFAAVIRAARPGNSGARGRAALIAAALLLASLRPAAACVGDCDGGGSVGVAELILGVNIALGLQPAAACPTMDGDGSNAVEIDELISAVRSALGGCPATATPTGPSLTPTPSRSPSAAPSATATGAPSPSPTPWAVCTDGPIAGQTPAPAAPCPARPGVFVNCFRSSGLALGHFEEGINGAAVADVDADGYPDVFFWNAAGGARLFRNLGSGMRFEAVADSPLTWLGADTAVAAAFGDLDNDGRPDLVVSLDRARPTFRCPRDQPFNTLHVFRNLGGGGFAEVGEAWGFRAVPPDGSDKPAGVGFALVDLNLDGRLDVIRYSSESESRPLTFLSQPDGATWADAGSDLLGDARGYTFTLFFTDQNHDQLLDAFLLNDFGNAPSKHFVRLDRSIRFEERILPPEFNAPMGAATADLNGDGGLDLVIADTGDQRVLSHGAHVEEAWGLKQNPSRYDLPQNCWSVGVLDLENDGFPDLFLACAGFRRSWLDKAASLVLRNRGGVFEAVTGLLPDEDVPSWDEGLAVADFDQDGRLDLLTGGNDAPPRLLWNQLPAGGGALALRLAGTRANAQGIGARVEVRAPGLPVQVREMYPGGSTWGYSDTELLFGLGQAQQAAVTIDWRPAGGDAVQNVDLPPGRWRISEP